MFFYIQTNQIIFDSSMRSGEYLSIPRGLISKHILF